MTSDYCTIAAFFRDCIMAKFEPSRPEVKLLVSFLSCARDSAGAAGLTSAAGLASVTDAVLSAAADFIESRIDEVKSVCAAF